MSDNPQDKLQEILHEMTTYSEEYDVISVEEAKQAIRDLVRECILKELIQDGSWNVSWLHGYNTCTSAINKALIAKGLL